MTLAPQYRRHFDSPISSPDAISSFASSIDIYDDYTFDANFDASTGFASTIPTPPELSYGNPPSDSWAFRHPQSDGRSTFLDGDGNWITDGASQTTPRLFLQQSAPNTVPEAYTPPPMHAGSYQAQQPPPHQQNQAWPARQQDWAHLAPGDNYRNLAFREQNHKRLSSGSSVASAGPDSPYTTASDHPHVVDTDSPAAYSPAPSEPFESPYSSAEQYTKSFTQASLFPTTYSVQSPTDNVAQYVAAQSAIKQGNRGRIQGQSRGRGGNMSAANSFADGGGSLQTDFDVTAELRRNIPSLDRNMSEVYQDELFNPSSQGIQSQRPSKSVLSPTYPNATFSERVQAANLARATSPIASLPEDRSPLREVTDYTTTGPEYLTSPHAPAGTPLGSVARIRAAQKSRSDAEAYAQHHQPISRHDLEATETISPKEAFADYQEPEESKSFALFSSPNLHLDQTSSNSRRNGSATTFQDSYNARSGLPVFSSQGSNAGDFSYVPVDHQNQHQQQAYPFHSSDPRRRQYSSMRSTQSESVPELPATLSSMESTKSDTGDSETVRPPAFIPASQPSSSSQEGGRQSSSSSSPPQRPADTSAHSGAYVCVAPSCSARFDSSTRLQKHRRDAHQANSPSNPATPSSTTSATASASQPPESSSKSNAQASSSTTPTASTVSRNNLPGPHKCDRINPSTGKPCNTQFSRSYDLTRHEETIHSGRKNKVRCQICTEPKLFSRSDALTRHMRVCHPDAEFAVGKASRRVRG